MELKSCPTARYSDGYNWACPDDIHLLSVRADSVLHRRKISFTSFLHLLWLFCNRISVSDAARLVSSNIKTVRTLFTSLRQCMAEDLLDNGVRRKIGGPGHIIEIDESKFGRRKYNRGRRVVGKWILGGYCRTTGECFLTECTNNKRDHHTLLRLIKQNVLPGTIILTDKWKGYNSLSHHGFIHLVVNHRQGFVDPLTGVHTNTCEGMWFHAKKHMRQGHGRTRVDSTAVSIALCEFVWLKKFVSHAMALSIDELYNKLFATVNDSKFDSDEVPDLFMVSVFDGEEEVASWDLTEELKENGMSRINYTDDDHDLNIIFMHNDFRDVLEDKDGDCAEVLNRSQVWNLVFRIAIVCGYVGSLILSFAFTLGYYRKSTKQIGMKKTLIACTMEILFDACALIAKTTGYFQSMIVSEKYPVEIFRHTTHCDLTVRLAALDGGVAQCLIYLLVLQPGVQEFFLLIAEIVEYCTQ
ncbi:hypothetical protein ACHWQZ_G000525 [Mnemiopsis leidyi]